MSRTQRQIDSALAHESSPGAGSLMRCVSVGVVNHHRLGTANKIARDQSDITHPSSVCGDACSLYTTLVVAIMNGETSKQELHNLIMGADISDRRLRHSFESYQDFSQWKQANPKAFQRPQFVCPVLLAVLWAFFTTDTFAEGAVLVVNRGGDTDTTGAIYGGLAGAYYGFDAIPKHWLGDLRRHDLVTRIADGIAILAAS